MTSAEVNPYFHFWLAINVTQTLGESTIHTLANKYSKVCYFLIIYDICVKWQWSSGDLQSEPSPHGIIQTRTLEWVAISSSRESSWSRDQTLISRPPVLARKIPWTEEPGRVQSIRPQRVGHDWARMHAHTHTHDIWVLGILYNSVLLCSSQLCSVKSYWDLEICCGGSIYIMEIGKCYTLGLFIFIS